MKTQEKKRIYTGFEEMASDLDINKEESGMTENTVEKKTATTAAKRVKADVKKEETKKNPIKRFGSWINRNKWWLIGTVGSVGIGYGLGRMHEKYIVKGAQANDEQLALPEADTSVEIDVPNVEVPSINVPGIDE